MSENRVKRLEDNLDNIKTKNRYGKREDSASFETETVRRAEEVGDSDEGVEQKRDRMPKTRMNLLARIWHRKIEENEDREKEVTETYEGSRTGIKSGEVSGMEMRCFGRGLGSRCIFRL